MVQPYEEGSIRDLIAGVNASLKTQEKEPFLLKRSRGYIGVINRMTKSIKYIRP